MPLVLSVGRCSKPTASPQSQSTYFHAFFFNVSPRVTERDAHISFPEAKESRKPKPMIFCRC